MRDNDNPIPRIVAQFGGQASLARLMGISQPTVFYWVRSGIVPSRRIPGVIAAGKRASPPVNLNFCDFFKQTEVDAS